MKTITSEEFDKKFDNGEDIVQYCDLSSGKRVNRERQKVNIDLPTWMVHSLDREARRIGVTRQSIVKMYVSERLETLHHKV
jgi:hypothetical protein